MALIEYPTDIQIDFGVRALLPAAHESSGIAKPLIAAPTTAGTGREVARGATDIVDDGRILGFHSWHLLPMAAICDPELGVAEADFDRAIAGAPADRGHETDPRIATADDCRAMLQHATPESA